MPNFPPNTTINALPVPNDPNPQHRRSISTSPPASRNSSLQKVWDEDYYTDEFIGGVENRFEGPGIPSLPPPATLTTRPFPKSIPLSPDEESCPVRQPRKHQRSLTIPLPFRSRQNSQSPQHYPQRSPVKENLDFEFMPTLTGDKDGVIKVADKSKGGLSSWFTGSSAPVTVGIPIGEQEADQDRIMMASPEHSRNHSPEREPTKLQKRPAVPKLASPSSTTPAKALPSASTSRFAFFTSPKTPITKTVQIPASMDDEFLTLDISAALFPSGSPADRDPFSPSSFKNLLMNAEGLLLKLQTAYKLRTLSLHELTAEKDVQAEELEEAETRAKHLKLQLEDMARKVAAQDSAMQELGAELAAERQTRAREREAREKSIALVKFSREEMGMMAAPEDFGVPSVSSPRRRKNKRHKSVGSTDFSAESDVDDDMSGGAESVFSRSRSPTISITSTIESTPEIMQASFGYGIWNINQPVDNLQRPKPVQQISTFQKILKGMSSNEQNHVTSPVKVEGGGGIGLEDGCSNCRGKNASVAWDAVGLLRAENKELKERVGDLETAVEGALDLVAGITPLPQGERG